MANVKVLAKYIAKSSINCNYIITLRWIILLSTGWTSREEIYSLAILVSLHDLEFGLPAKLQFLQALELTCNKRNSEVSTSHKFHLPCGEWTVYVANETLPLAF
jgi:hypothetical protein